MKVNTQLASLTIILSLAQENDNTDAANLRKNSFCLGLF